MLMMNATRRVQNKANIQSKTIQIKTSKVILVSLCGSRSANLEMFPHQIDILRRSLITILPIPKLIVIMVLFSKNSFFAL